MKKTNFLLVSLVAMMSVGVARAESTTKEYVDSQDTALYNRIKTQDSRLGLIRDWVNPQDPVTKQRAVLETEADDAYRAINEIHSALAGKADASDIPDVSDMETKTHAAEAYQPKGSYLTSEAADAAYQPKGEYATAAQLEGKADASTLNNYVTSVDAAATYQPKGSYATTEQLEAKADASTLNNYVTSVDAAATYQPKGSYATTEQLEAKADATDIPDVSDMETKTSAAATYQPKLTEAQLAAANSGVTTTTVAQVGANMNAISLLDAGKQNLIDAEHPLSAELVDGLAPVATSGSYVDLSNKPQIPAAQVNADWNATEGVAQILNKPSVYTQSETDTLLNAKANADDVYTKSETYSKSQVDTALNAVSGDVGSIGTQISEALADYTTTADLESTYATKTALGLKADKTGVYPKTVNVPGSGQYVLGFVDGVQMYIPIVDANGVSGEPVVAQATE